jgi:RNA polymerase sigma-70 factor, ECF subfamily
LGAGSDGEPGRLGRRAPVGDLTAARRLHEVYQDWDALYLDNVAWVYRLLFAKVGNRPDAEDLTSSVFLAALGPLRIDASKAAVRAYLAATARTVLASFWRGRLGIELTVIEDSVPAALAAGAAVEDEIESDAPVRAEQVLGGLSPRHRRILELRFLQGLSINDAAAAMEVSVSNAKVLQHRALRTAAGLDQGGET